MVRSYGETAFHAAVKDYIESLESNKKEKDFVAACYDPARPCSTEETNNDSLTQMQKQHAQNASTTCRVVKTVVSALKDYDGVINALGKFSVSRRI